MGGKKIDRQICDIYRLSPLSSTLSIRLLPPVYPSLYKMSSHFGLTLNGHEAVLCINPNLTANNTVYWSLSLASKSGNKCWTTNGHTRLNTSSSNTMHKCHKSQDGYKSILSIHPPNPEKEVKISKTVTVENYAAIVTMDPVLIDNNKLSWSLKLSGENDIHSASTYGYLTIKPYNSLTSGSTTTATNVTNTSTTDKAANKPVDKAVDNVANKPVDKAVDNVANKPVDKPVDKPINKDELALFVSLAKVHNNTDAIEHPEQWYKHYLMCLKRHSIKGTTPAEKMEFFFSVRSDRDARVNLMKSLFTENKLVFSEPVMPLYNEWLKTFTHTGKGKVNRYIKMNEFIKTYKLLFTPITN
jgi:hypothetical protein